MTREQKEMIVAYMRAMEWDSLSLVDRYEVHLRGVKGLETYSDAELEEEFGALLLWNPEEVVDAMKALEIDPP